ncbi:MAG TPA: TonB-dependent receptor, partial [Vicinamibacteria bacterium]|nr:TonB-dependent receptor [Vicinamibacteria bacterium]
VLSGPLKKGAAWFLASYHPSLQSTRRTVRFRANNQAGTYASSTTAHDVSANVAGKFQDRVRARFAVNTNPLVLDGVLPSENGIGNPEADYAVVTTVSNYTFSSHVEFAATPHLLVSARGGHWFANTHQAGIHQGPLYRFARSNVGMEGVPLALQGPQGTSNTFGNSETTRNVITRTTAQVDGTAYFSAAGRHAMKGGFHLDRPGNDVLSGATGNVVLLSWGDAFQGRRGPFGYYLVLSNGAVPERGTLTQGDVQASNLGLFIQDSWTISGRLTLNLGLRAERERVPSYTTAYGTSPTAIAFGLGDKLAPRLGAAWDIRGDGKWKVYGSWGIFYDAMKYALARDLFGGVKALGYWYTLDSPDWPNLMRTGCPPACPGTLIQGPIDFSRPKNEPDGNAIDPDLEPFRLQEAVVGIDHALSRVLSLGARYVHKHVDTVVEDMGALDSQGNQVYIIGNPGFHRAAQTGFGPAFPKAVRDYDALELTLDKRMASRWAVRASYLLSRLHGNYSGLSYGPEGAPFLNHGPAFDHPVVVFGADGRPVVGPLDSDRTHQLKAHAIYDSPFGTSLGTSIRVLSGTPVTREAYFIPGHRYSVKYRGRGSDGRLPTLSQVDLHLQHEIKLGGAKRLQASVTVQNLFDQDAPLLRYPWELRDVADVGEAEFFRGFDMQEIIAAQGLRGDPLFLKDYAFQPPREIRLGLKLMF